MVRKLLAKIFKNGNPDVDDEESEPTLEEAQRGADDALEKIRTKTREMRAAETSGPMPVAVG